MYKCILLLCVAAFLAYEASAQGFFSGEFCGRERCGFCESCDRGQCVPDRRKPNCDHRCARIRCGDCEECEDGRCVPDWDNRECRQRNRCDRLNCDPCEHCEDGRCVPDFNRRGCNRRDNNGGRGDRGGRGGFGGRGDRGDFGGRGGFGGFGGGNGGPRSGFNGRRCNSVRRSSVTACEGAQAVLSCPANSFFRIERAQYGGAPRGQCGYNGNSVCQNIQDVTAKVEQTCDPNNELKQSCSIGSSNFLVPSDPCSGQAKKLLIDYECCGQ